MTLRIRTPLSARREFPTEAASGFAGPRPPSCLGGLWEAGRRWLLLLLPWLHLRRPGAGRTPERSGRPGPAGERRMARAASVRLLLGVLWPVAAIDIYTPRTLDALNGTDVRLKCTFHSRVIPGEQVTVTWNFRSHSGGPDQTVFYYHEQPYPATTGRFAGRVTWDGNIQKSDASLMLWNVHPADNGTFQCQVKNPPDVDGNIGEIQLAVVLKVTFSEIHILALTIGSACVLMIIIVVVVVVCRQQRRKRHEKRMEMVETERGRSEKEKLEKAELEEALATRGEQA